MATNCKVDVTREQGVLIVALSGLVNSANAEDVDREVIGIAILEDGAFILDLAELSYMNSAGLRILLRIAKHFDRREQTFLISAPNNNVHDVMAISGLTQLIEIFETRVGALEYLRAK